ncbi:MAG: hypothetical protein ACO3VH_07185 [Ilumatobacteraceae bacterium]
MPTFIQRKPASRSDIQAAETRVIDILARTVATLEERLSALEVKVQAMHLGSTCHPEWVVVRRGLAAQITRSRIVESILASTDADGISVKELAAYLHLPSSRIEVLREDLRFLADEDRVQRMPRHRWRIKDSRNAT